MSKSESERRGNIGCRKAKSGRRCEQVRHVRGPTAEAALPEGPGTALARVKPRGTGPVRPGQRRAQGVAMLGDQDQVDMVGHQRPAPHGNAVRGARGARQLATGEMVRIAEDRPLAAVASCVTW
jgi:hypothetical protein